MVTFGWAEVSVMHHISVLIGVVVADDAGGFSDEADQEGACNECAYYEQGEELYDALVEGFQEVCHGIEKPDEGYDGDDVSGEDGGEGDPGA